jgi:hypothetical protein
VRVGLVRIAEVARAEGPVKIVDLVVIAAREKIPTIRDPKGGRAETGAVVGNAGRGKTGAKGDRNPVIS